MCWYTQYEASPPSMRSCHQDVPFMSVRHSCEVFQSSRTSWSSKIIDVGTVESSQRTAGSHQASKYRWQYSSKSATSLPGGTLVFRRVASHSCVAPVVSSA